MGNSSSSTGGLKPGFNPPRTTGTLGMWLFLAALFVLFASGMLGFVVIRFWFGHAPPPGTLHVPLLLWMSTAVILAASFTIHRAVAAVRRERQGSFRFWLMFTLALSFVFVGIQAPALASLLASRRSTNIGLYGLVFVFILLHAAHVLGGIIRLIYVTARAGRGAYDHESYLPIVHTAMYWHFLDGVWIIMFLTFWIMG